ncbi:hypothetical protein FKM82_024049 [Ascaphus truei]
MTLIHLMSQPLIKLKDPYKPYILILKLVLLSQGHQGTLISMRDPPMRNILDGHLNTRGMKLWITLDRSITHTDHSNLTLIIPNKIGDIAINHIPRKIGEILVPLKNILILGTNMHTYLMLYRCKTNMKF